MAYFCRHCRLATDRRYESCPECGRSLSIDPGTCGEFEREGYRIIRGGQGSAGNEDRQQVRIDDDDVLSSLRRGYQDSLRRSPNTEPVREPEAPDRPFFASYGSSSGTAGGSSGAGASRRPEPEPDRDSFFDRYIVDEPVVMPEPIPEPEWDAPIMPEPVRPSAPRIDLDFSGIGHTLSVILQAIPWRLVFTVVLLGMLVSGVMTIWNMRYVILGSIVGFAIEVAMELMPAILVIGGIVLVIKSIFR